MRARNSLGTMVPDLAPRSRFGGIYGRERIWGKTARLETKGSGEDGDDNCTSDASTDGSDEFHSRETSES